MNTFFPSYHELTFTFASMTYLNIFHRFPQRFVLIFWIDHRESEISLVQESSKKGNNTTGCCSRELSTKHKEQVDQHREVVFFCCIQLWLELRT